MQISPERAELARKSSALVSVPGAPGTFMYHDGPLDLKQRALIYIRVSTARADMVSPQQQRKICLDFAAFNGFEVVGEPIEDIDVSGRSFSKRKVNSMIERVRAGEAGTILVWQFSRWSRNAHLGLAYLKLLEQAGGQLIAVTESADTTTSTGILMRGIMLQFAEHYSNIVGEGWKETHMRRLNMGLPISGRPRFGYTRCPDCRRKEDRPDAYHHCDSCKGVLQIDPVRGLALEWAFQERLKGKGFPYIANKLSDRGIRTIDGHMLSNQALAKTMDSGFAAGIICMDRRPYVEGKRNTTDIREYVYYPGAHEAVIPPDVWEEYYDLRLTKFETNPAQLYAKHSMSGIFRCGEILKSGEMCKGSLTTGGNNAQGIPWFRCANSKSFKTCEGKQVTRTQLETFIKEWVTANAREEGAALEEMKLQAHREEAQTNIESLRRAVDIAKARVKRLQDGYLAGDFEREYFLNKKPEMTAEVEALEGQLKSVVDTLNTKRPSPEEFQGLLAIWDRLKPDELNSALKQVISYATVTRVGLERRFFEYNVMPRWEFEAPDLRHHNPGNPTDPNLSRDLRARSGKQRDL